VDAPHLSFSGREPDSRLVGFPSPLDNEIVKMAVPSLASVVMDPLMGMVGCESLPFASEQLCALRPL
jgi:hypothetical protein